MIGCRSLYSLDIQIQLKYTKLMLEIITLYLNIELLQSLHRYIQIIFKLNLM